MLKTRKKACVRRVSARERELYIKKTLEKITNFNKHGCLY